MRSPRRCCAIAKTITGADSELLELARQLDPTLEQTFATLRGNLDAHADKIEKKITSALKQRSDSLQKRVSARSPRRFIRSTRCRSGCSALPTFLPRYGFGLIDELTGTLPQPAWEHFLAILD